MKHNYKAGWRFEFDHERHRYVYDVYQHTCDRVFHGWPDCRLRVHYTLSAGNRLQRCRCFHSPAYLDKGRRHRTKDEIFVARVIYA